MPRKKRVGQSPARAEFGRAHEPDGADLPRAHSSRDFNTSRSQTQHEIIHSMQEMFSHLDPEVIYMVLSEADFKVENAMDSLLELSCAAESIAPPPPSVSGFEQAASLLGLGPSPADLHTTTSQDFSNHPDPQPQLSPDETHLTEEFDTLIDQELETLTSQRTHYSTLPLSALPPPSQSIPLSSLPLTSQTQLPAPQTVSELEQVKLDNNPESVSVAGRGSFSCPGLSEARGGTSPVSELSFGGVLIPEQKNVSLDFSHLTLEASSTEPRPSAFQVYRRPDKLRPHPVNTVLAKPNETFRAPAMLWNTQADEFRPYAVGPAFITPIVPNPTPWNTNPIPAAQWLAHGPIRQAPLKPSATVPKSWTLPHQNRLKLEGHVLVLLRGAPGSGKSTLAKAMLEQNRGGVVLSTDEYFIQNGQYHFEHHLLGEAHEWNHQRAKEAFEKGQTPIIIDNTNMQCWEMKPYVAMAQKHRYKVLFREPDTWWKNKPRELERRTRHEVSKEKIRRMLDRYDRFVSIQSIMNSQKPEPLPSVVNLTETEAGHPQGSLPPGLSHPDLVDDSGLSKLSTHLFSSLPDVSSVNQTFAGEEHGELKSYSSKESMPHKNIQEGSVTPQSDLLDGDELDLELDACLMDTESEMGNLSRRTNEEFGLLKEEKFLEQPVAFSESIGQRVRRDRVQNKNALEVCAIDEPVNSDLNFDSSGQDKDPKDESMGQNKNEGFEDDLVAEGGVVRPELLDFVGDWPLESQGQRQGRRQNSRDQSVKNTNLECNTAEDEENPSAQEDEHSDADKLNVEEFQKLVDLLQGGRNTPPGLYHSPVLSKQTGQHLSSLGEKDDTLSLETVTRSDLPDCVQEWKSLECTDSSKDCLNPQSPAKQRTDQTEQSSQVSSEKSTGIHIQDEVEEEKKSGKSPIVQGSRGSVDSESSLEKRRSLSRRVGKSCKLALTFTNQSPSSPCSQSPVTSHQPDLTPTGEARLLPMATCVSATTQTHPQDFALLWRIDQQKCSASFENSSSTLVILEGNSLRFTPKTIEEQSDGQQGVPYRVVHEKGSQVEDNDFKESHSKQDHLAILSRHFRQVSMDILEDLYEKCHQDMEWTTNLLLDSGERLYRDDDDKEEGNLDSPVPKGDSSVKKFMNIEPTETVLGSKSDQPRAACSNEQNVADISTSSASSISPKSQDTNLSDLSQANENWSTGPSSQSESEGTDESVEKEKCELGRSSVTLRQPAEDTEAVASEPDPGDHQGPEREEIPDTQSEQGGQCLEGASAEWSEEERDETRAEVDKITQLLLRQIDEEEEERKAREKERKRTGQGKREPRPIDIQTLELKLTTELALQLTELFGPVGVSPGDFSPDDCAVKIDLNLAKLLHQKWKDTIQEKHRQAALSYQLLQGDSIQWGASQASRTGQRDFLNDGSASLSGQSGLHDEIPFMDHWNAPCPRVSLRDIMIEEQVMQESIEKSRSSRSDMDKKDSAAKLKENQLFSMFPTIDRHFLRDIFRDHNYSLDQTEQFLHSLLDDGPVKNVVAPESAPQRNGTHRAQSRERRWKQKDGESEAHFQDTEDPEYEDFRTEAMLQKKQQIESFNKAAEAYRQGKKDVASFYAQQGRMHGEKMREANHRAAMQIFERVNASLLPQNILDLHGLHVDEAIHHLQQVLTNKTLEWQQGKCHPQLSVITGRGNRSQGGVARIRPAVLDYLKSQHYSYSEPKTGLVLVTLH